MMKMKSLMTVMTKYNKIQEYAIENHVPIISNEGLEFIIDIIKQNNIKKVLEIGSAIGYSAISFAMNDCFVTTIERNDEMYNLAIQNINDLGFNERIKVINGDALLIDGINEEFDLIFIDAAKAQYQKFFEKYQVNLSKNGIIICDNLNFHNLDITKVSRSTRQLITKLENFKNYLKENNDYQTTFYNVGDGMSVSKKRD